MRLWTARLFGSAAAQMLLVAIGWHMYELTGSAWDLGLVGLYQFVPALLLALLAGHVVDRHHRGRIVAACFAAQGCCRAGAAGCRPWPSRFARAAARPVAGAGRGARLPDAGAAGAHAAARAAADAAARDGVQFGRHAGRDHRRPGAGRPAVRRGHGRGVRRQPAVLRRRRRAADAAALRARAAAARAGHAGHGAGGRALHLDAQARARRRFARPLRGAAGRRGRAAADLRQGHPAHGTLGPGPAAQRAGGGCAGDVDRADAAAAGAPRGAHAADGGGRLRALHGGVRLLAQLPRLARRARDLGRRATWSTS